MNQQEIKQEIRRLAEERNALLLAHNYQRDEIQEIADITGDSLGLSMEAARTEREVIVFCGVHFMAESAAILAPDKIVLLPRPDAGCPMADMVTAEGLRAMKARHPGAPVVTYVNSSAAVKAESDICCTSANAVRVVNSLEAEEVILVPDRNLGRYIAAHTRQDLLISGKGYCPTHERLQVADVERALAEHPDAALHGPPRVSPGSPGAGPPHLLDQRHVRLCPAKSGEKIHRRHRGRDPLPAAAGESRPRSSSCPPPG